MEEALAEARQALDRGEFPVGCVIVHEGKIIATGSRQGTAGDLVSETDHAEILALKQLERSAPGRSQPTDPLLHPGALPDVLWRDSDQRHPAYRVCL